MIVAVREADRDGLRPEDYHLTALQSALPAFRTSNRSGYDVEAWVTLDLLLTDGFLAYGADLLDGRAEPQVLDPDQNGVPRSRDLTHALESALSRHDVDGALDALAVPLDEPPTGLVMNASLL